MTSILIWEGLITMIRRSPNSQLRPKNPRLRHLQEVKMRVVMTHRRRKMVMMVMMRSSIYSMIKMRSNLLRNNNIMMPSKILRK
jgi:hypothetical protein